MFQLGVLLKIKSGYNFFEVTKAFNKLLFQFIPKISSLTWNPEINFKKRSRFFSFLDMNSNHMESKDIPTPVTNATHHTRALILVPKTRKWNILANTVARFLSTNPT